MTPPRIVGYDTLVIAIGSVTNGFGTPGVAEHAALLETMAQAERLNQRLDCRPSSIAGALRIDNPLGTGSRF